MRIGRTLIIALLATALPTVAIAGGINLSWNDCGLAGSRFRTFTCDDNSGANTLVTSFAPEFDITDAVGWDVRIDLQSADATDLNPWWQMVNAGSCRGSAIPTCNVAF